MNDERKNPEPLVAGGSRKSRQFPGAKLPCPCLCPTLRPLRDVLAEQARFAFWTAIGNGTRSALPLNVLVIEGGRHAQ